MVQGRGLGTPGRAGRRISGEEQSGLRRGAAAPQYIDREGDPRTSAEVNASDIQFLGQRGDGANGATERVDENSPKDEEAEIGEKPKAASSRSVKKSGSKRALWLKSKQQWPRR